MQKNLNKKYKLFLFDLDGTLLDTAKEFHVAWNEVLKKEGDLFVAVNVETQQRRIVQIDQSLVESLAKGQRPPGSGRGLLKG